MEVGKRTREYLRYVLGIDGGCASEAIEDFLAWRHRNDTGSAAIPYYTRADSQFAVTGTAQLSLRLEFVSDLPNGQDVPWLCRIGLQLTSQLGDMGINGAAHDRSAVSPDCTQ